MAVPKRILIDLGRQVLTAYEGTKEVHCFDCTTGDKDNLTPKGKFKIYYKHKIHFSSKYKRQMNNALFFNGGIAIHESHLVGATSYLKFTGFDFFGSHGCVRLSHEEAETLFNWAQVGIPVTVQ